MRYLAALLIAVTACLTACGPAVPVTIRLLLHHRQAVISALGFVSNSGRATTHDVQAAYSDLSGHLRAQSLTPATLEEMEHRLVFIRSRSDSLKRMLQFATTEADTFFDLMERRAEENQTEELREPMLESVERHREEFESHAEAASAELASLDAAVQKYDDIVGHAQVGIAMDQMDVITGQVVTIQGEAGQLNTDLQRAIRDGLDAINALGLSDAGGAVEDTTGYMSM